MEKELPKNWVETSPKNISEIIRGVSYSKDDAFQEEFENSCLILRGGNVQDGNVVEGKDNVYVDCKYIKKEQLVRESDVLIVGSTGSKQLIGKAATIREDNELISFGAFLMILRAHKKINGWYFSYYFQTDFYRESIRNLAGGVNINNIRKEYIENLVFPLPPLTEQNRIVAKLDSLFAQLESIKTSMAKIPVLLKNFRQQVLTQAVTGKLTEEWRKGKNLESIEKNFHKNPKGDLLKFIKEFGLNVIVDDSNWVETNFFNLCVLKRGFDLPSYKRDTDGKYPIASSSGVKSFHTDFNAENGIVVGRSGSVGKVFYIKEKFWPLNTTLYSENFNNNYPKYVYYFFLTFNFEYYSSSTAVPTLNRNNFITEKISIPPLEEQKEIVSRVESLFAKADAIEEKYKNLKAKIETLPQTILHKAFKGELTEQLETDGDARVLLEEIVALKNGEKPKKVVSKKYLQPDEEVLRIVAEESTSYPRYQ
ncbi:MAG: hypothetical protein E2600_13470 [Chryseobacterium sp.]|nr:hypothetical protein [Chryseobacterium sp.]